MALVLFFVPEPVKGVAEMTRVVKPGGSVSAYVWDIPGGGFPYEPVFAELRAMGHTPMGPPRPEASDRAVMQALWRNAGLEDVEVRVIEVERSYDNLDEFWNSIQGSPSIKASTAKMSAAETNELKARVRERLPAGAGGRVTLAAWANAVKGRV